MDTSRKTNRKQQFLQGADTLRHDKKNIIVLTGKEMSSGVGGEPLTAPFPLTTGV